jgi:hypothetical protein
MMDDLIEYHYIQCVESNGVMGRTLCELLVESRNPYIQDLECEKRALKYPNFAADMFIACRRGKYSFK